MFWHSNKENIPDFAIRIIEREAITALKMGKFVLQTYYPGEGWEDNQLRYDTYEEARKYAIDMAKYRDQRNSKYISIHHEIF